MITALNRNPTRFNTGSKIPEKNVCYNPSVQSGKFPPIKMGDDKQQAKRIFVQFFPFKMKKQKTYEINHFMKFAG